jgi:hypothetical protein
MKLFPFFIIIIKPLISPGECRYDIYWFHFSLLLSFHFHCFSSRRQQVPIC